MCNVKPEVDTLHVLACEHSVFQNCRNEVVTALQLKVLRLLEEDMFPLCFLEWMLDDEHNHIEAIPQQVMSALNIVGRRSVWFNFLATRFMQWIKWKHESTKWLAKFMCLCAESLHAL